MIRKMPVPGLDPGMETGFPKGSCSNKMLERNRFNPKRFRSRAASDLVLGALGLILTRAVVDPDRASVLGRAIVWIGHLGVREGIHPAKRRRDKGRAETLAEYVAGAEMGNFGACGLGRAGAVISLRAIGLHDADRPAGTGLGREGATARRNRYRGNAGQYRKT